MIKNNNRIEKIFQKVKTTISFKKKQVYTKSMNMIKTNGTTSTKDKSSKANDTLNKDFSMLFS